MIICSKRVFLNVLTQLWNRDTLLNANYFIADQPNGIGYQARTKMTYNSEGQVVIQNNATRAISGYNIHYLDGNVLDPQQYVTTLLTQTGSSSEASVYDHVLNEYNKDSTKAEIYNSLFTNKLEGNGIQILIFYHDDTLIDFGNLICEYLSTNFGCDIVFLDPLCRDNVMGKGYYQGNKENGLQLSNYIRNYNLIEDFSKQITIAGGSVALTSNLHTWLHRQDWESMYRLYTLIFPDEPLVPGNYTEEQLRDIIIGKCLEHMPTNNLGSDSAINKLIWSTSDLWNETLDDYDADDSESLFEQFRSGNLDLEGLFS